MKISALISTLAIVVVASSQPLMAGGLAPAIEEDNVTLTDEVTGFAPVATTTLGTIAPLALGLGTLVALSGLGSDGSDTNGTNGTNGTN